MQCLLLVVVDIEPESVQMFGQIFIIVVAVWMIALRWQKRHMIRLWNQLKNNYKWLPFIGHAYMFVGSDEDRMKMFQRLGKESIEKGGLIALWQGSRLYVMIADAEFADVILKNCLEKDYVMKCSRLLTGNGSVFAPVSIWRPRRKFLAPTFRPKNLVHFVNIFSEQSSIMVKQLRKAVDSGTFSIWKYITTYSMDAVCESTLGVRVNAQNQSTEPFLKAFEEICRLDSARFCQPWFYNDTVYKMTAYYKHHKKNKSVICSFIDKIIKSKRKSMEEIKHKAELNQEFQSNGLKTFLELLIESSGSEEGYTDVELLEETLVLVLAGTDTSAVGTAFATVMLSRHPEIQEKVYQELQEVFGDSDRAIVSEDLSRLNYLDAVIRETLRLYPSVPIIVRRVEKDITLPSGITLVHDCGIVINIWAVQRNPKHWGEDAEIFRPERFIDTPLKHPAAFLAFSYGPRACLGYRYAMMSMKTAMAALLREYRILPAKCGDSKFNSFEKNIPLRVKFDVMMKAVDDFAVELQPRLR